MLGEDGNLSHVQAGKRCLLLLSESIAAPGGIALQQRGTLEGRLSAPKCQQEPSQAPELPLVTAPVATCLADRPNCICHALHVSAGFSAS